MDTKQCETRPHRLVAAVTGATGVVGRNIVDLLLEKGWAVKVLTRNKRVTTEGNISIVYGDINNALVLEELLTSVDAVFHCAAELNDEAKMQEVNIEGVRTLLDLLLTSTVNYFCYISSAGVVGPTKEKLVTELTECMPHNEYERTKHEAEKLILSSSFTGRVCVLRPTNVIDNTKKGLIDLPIQDRWKDKLRCFFNGKEGAHLVHAKDVAAAAVFFMGKPLLEPEVYFVSRDEESQNTLSGVYALALKSLGKECKYCVYSLPVIVPYFIRLLIKGKSLHGDSRFSAQKIKDAGFTFPLSFERVVNDICESSRQNN